MKNAQTTGGGAAADVGQRMDDALSAFEKSVCENQADAPKLDMFIRLIQEREMKVRLSRH